MPELKPIKGARALLFERLIDLDPSSTSELRPFRTLSPRDLRGSVRRELARLLDTRRHVSARVVDTREQLSVLDYGIPDISDLLPRSLTDRQLMAAVIRQAVQAFEPRLGQVQVSVDPDDKDPRTVVVRIEGNLRYGSVVEAVSFPVALRVRQMETEGHGAGA
ncbi:MAG: type VI secretion system baseplate subunit TssE [Alphaproteobacteria bacterium]|nr:type VI secretion system baseplate subunit TssE [Alphaproteobacteria bacterium]